MSSPPWDYIAKLVCIGDSGCGKSSLTIRLCEGRFSPHHDVTIGVEFGSRIVPVGPPHSLPPPPPAAIPTTDDDAADSASSTPPANAPAKPEGLPEPRRAPPPPSAADAPPPQKHMKLSLWDTAGQETYKSVTRSYFRGASGALLVFDLSRRQTFEHVTDWLNDLRQIAEPDIVVILVGTRPTLRRRRCSSAPTSAKCRGSKPRRGRADGVLEYVETSARAARALRRPSCGSPSAFS
ncbi:GTP-binding protein YPTC4 [Verticillium alfalfae VaMs.102]|uniref:GTP-binding protein YPTC4 n=1 Tax=Verticillium alfalfae (strain VaMs.102 / ATCC MYA-4576 / FGSC 10136) TaxID=526221 RepID=C9SCU5_VERA1|nr:GTP-binding protein YPTC4 [Verticillium alfalfae VaMs.102]EEY16910.1 GTP-binding protein YPTC4 [Verticillium alfalfae VaMs.102]